MSAHNAPLTNVEVPLPEEVIEELGGRGEDLPARVRAATVLMLFQAGNISRGYAAELLGMSQWDFYDLLAKYKVPALHYRHGEEKALKDLPPTDDR